MKKIVYLVFASLLFVACSQNDEIIEPFGDDNLTDSTIIVGVNLAGEVSVDEDVLTRAETESRDLIGIQVYRNGSYFCYGLFDSMQGVKLALKAGSTYSFKCTMVKNGKDKLYCSSNNSYDYTFPFYASRSTLLCNNTFTYNSNSLSSLSGYGVSMSNSSSRYGWRPVDRFYGETSNYTPTVNGIVSIPLRRVSCGIKVKVSGVTDGSVNVRCYNDYNTFFENTNITNSAESQEEMYCMYNVRDAWQYADADYQESIKLSVKWTRGNGIVQDLGTKTTYVKRNVMNIIKIKLSTNDTDVDVDVDPEGGEMGEEDEDLSN